MPSNRSHDSVFRCCVLLVIGIALALLCKADSSCQPTSCDISQCPHPTDCPHGLIDDQCHCCRVCLKKLGEQCGPAIGRCAQGLNCLTSEHSDPVLTNLVITGEKQTGTCGLLNCTNVKCEDSRDHDLKCHNDSYKLISDDSCCQSK